MLEPEILVKPAMTIVGLETPFIHALSPETNNFKVIPPLWDTFSHRMGELAGRIGQASYGIIYSRPEEQRSHPHELQYIAGAQVRPGAAVPEGMMVIAACQKMRSNARQPGSRRGVTFRTSFLPTPKAWCRHDHGGMPCIRRRKVFIRSCKASSAPATFRSATLIKLGQARCRPTESFPSL